MPEQPASKRFHLNWSELIKILKSFAYSASSLMIILFGIIAALPEDQVPNWLVWLVPSVGALNALLYGFQLWLSGTKQ